MMRARLTATFLLLLACAPARAQDTPSVEIGVGYAFLRDEEIKESFPLGWYADIAGNISDSLGLVAEVGGSYKTVQGDVEDLKLSVHTAMGGARLTRRAEGANAYLQLLAGAARAKISLLGESDSATDFALQPGVGLEFRMGESMGLRIGGDYRRIFTEGEKTSEWRATAGLVFRSGRR